MHLGHSGLVNKQGLRIPSPSCRHISRRWHVTRAVFHSPAPPPGKPRFKFVGVAAASPAADGMCTGKASWPQQDKGRIRAPQLSKSDAAFEAEGCHFVWGMGGVDMHVLNDLFVKVGFPRREPAKLEEALQHSHTVLWIRSSRTSRWAQTGQLLGFARATSDGALSATIWDVAVNPAWQRTGLGKGAVERLTASLIGEGITTITLYAEPGVVELYKRLGFVADPAGIKGMAFQRKSKRGKALVAAAA